MNHYADRDFARSGGMPLANLERILQDMRNEPQWRKTADKCADYYDHKQASPEWLARIAKTGEPMTIINLIQRTINGALGQEAKTRLNWKVDVDSNHFADVGSVLGERLSEFQREARTDLAISEAYSSMLRTGIGWVEVSRNPDPLGYFGRATAVHRNEVFWDWRARAIDKSDARWIVRQRWVDIDEAVSLMPQFREIFDIGTHSGPITDVMATHILSSRGEFESIHATRRSFSVSEEEWLDNSVRKRVRFYSVYYKEFRQMQSLVSGTRRVRFNPQNPVHIALLQSGGAKLMSGPSFVWRHAMFAGPYRLFDIELKSRICPLIPFVCYSCDDDYSPYGLVHGMIQPQDEFNMRRSRLMWLLQAKQVFVDRDALDPEFNDLVDLATEVMRPDAMFVLNKNRTNKDALRIEHNLDLSAEQTRVMDDAAVKIQDQPGLFSPQFGSNAVGARSGIALNSLMEQSVSSLGETSDNYRLSRQLVGEAAMEMIAEDHMAPNMRVQVGTGKRRRVVVLNTFSPEGLPVNHVEDAAVKVALGDVPVTPAYRSQQQVFLSQAIQSVGNDPIARAVLVPALLEAGDLEHREQYARWMRQKAGVPEPEDMGEDGPYEQQQAQAAQAAGQLQQRGQMAALANQEADAELKRAKTVTELVKARDIATAPMREAQAAANEDQLIAQALELA